MLSKTTCHLSSRTDMDQLIKGLSSEPIESELAFERGQFRGAAYRSLFKFVDTEHIHHGFFVECLAGTFAHLMQEIFFKHHFGIVNPLARR